MSATSRSTAILVARLRDNAEVCCSEQERDLPSDSKAELANNAREWDNAADALADALEAYAAREKALLALCDRWFNPDVSALKAEIRAILENAT